MDLTTFDATNSASVTEQKQHSTLTAPNEQSQARDLSLESKVSELDPSISEKGKKESESYFRESATRNVSDNVAKQRESTEKTSPQQSFDYGIFLRQMRDPSAQPIARYVKSFEQEFERKTRTVNEQVKYVTNFLERVSVKMRECEVWHRPVTTDDKEKDEILHQKIQIFRWIKEKHLDIPTAQHNEQEQFLEFAKSELLKINDFKAPRDKLICILNCCKVIFGLIRHVDGEEGADKFLPILIYVVLKANPEHLVSNVQYISRFRNPEKLQSESSYYLSSLMGAISFIENMDASSLTISQEEFDKCIESTMKELERERPKLKENNTRDMVNYDNAIHPSKHPSNLKTPLLNTAQAKVLIEKGGNMLAQWTFQKPLSVVGKIFSEINNEMNDPTNNVPSLDAISNSSSRSVSPHRHSPHVELMNGSHSSSDNEGTTIQAARRSFSFSSRSSRTSHTSRESTDFSDLQEEVARASEVELQTSLATLRSMFPNMDPDICEDVLQSNEWRMNQAVDQLLELSDSNVNNVNEVGDLYIDEMNNDNDNTSNDTTNETR
ncbi:10877_t:CDS:10 [Acaulospora morrowiae]|uniref:10877_t:CDS:1 n=1 Tax=Acaulospora morrowiae TaxID=94023 RepID=A0A9N9D631_9GLOM|nr:10877_t:CDS:10 [Acaulospora morrowiae]